MAATNVVDPAGWRIAGSSVITALKLGLTAVDRFPFEQGVASNRDRSGQVMKI